MISRVFSVSKLASPLPVLLLCAAVCATAPALAQTPSVVVPVVVPVVVASIKPLQLIAAAVTDGISVPTLISKVAQDPHHSSLRPSERRNLQDAALVLWAGPLLELPLEEVIGSLVVPVITAQHLPQMIVLDVDGVPDPHLWLDSRNARQIGLALQNTLSQLDPTNAARYAANNARFTEQLDKLDAELQQALLPLQTQAWAVSHHAFRYFARQYGLQEPLALTDTGNNALGVRSALTVREQMAAQQIHCLLTEPTENHVELASLLDDKNFRIVTADGLGMNLSPSADAYAQLLRQLSQALQTCMGAHHE
jgi:zinc transport system substrate-binding protein